MSYNPNATTTITGYLRDDPTTPIDILLSEITANNFPELDGGLYHLFTRPDESKILFVLEDKDGTPYESPKGVGVSVLGLIQNVKHQCSYIDADKPFNCVTIGTQRNVKVRSEKKFY